MARLSAHLQCAHALYTSKAGSLCSSTKGGAAFCALRDWRDWRDWRVGSRARRLSVECKLEKKLGDTGVCARKERSSSVRCSRVAAAAAAEALPWSVEDLEQRFGQAGVKFVEAAGYRIVEMRLDEGSSARIVLQSALVSSYKSRMWHGGVEELLYAAVVPGMDESQRPTTVGGVALRVWEAQAGSESNLATTECWDVENVRSNPAKFVQVTLSTTSRDSPLIPSCSSINFVDGAYALGLQGYKYLSTPPNSSPGPLGLISEKASSEEGMFSKVRWFSGGIEDVEERNNSSIRTEDEMIVEEGEMVRMKGGFDRLYSEAPDCVSLLDRGKRRTIHFHYSGFGDIRLSNPGEESGLEDWDSFVCIELARLSQPVHLQPGQEWRAAQQLENPSK